MPRTGNWMLAIGSVALATTSLPLVPAAQAQGWNNSGCANLSGGARERCERAGWNRNDNRNDRRNDNRWDRRDRERERRKDAKTDGVVAGVAGTLLLGGIIAAVASSGNKNKNRGSDRRAYCEDRYGNYDERSDSYRASDGRWYPCQ